MSEVRSWHDVQDALVITEILRSDQPRDLIKSLFDDYEPGLSDTIERLPYTVQGIVQALAPGTESGICRNIKT